MIPTATRAKLAWAAWAAWASLVLVGPSNASASAVLRCGDLLARPPAEDARLPESGPSIDAMPGADATPDRLARGLMAAASSRSAVPNDDPVEWMRAIARLETREPTVREYSALVYAWNGEAFQREDVREELRLAIANAYSALAGRSAGLGEFPHELPAAVVARADERARAFYLSVFQAQRSRVRLSPVAQARSLARRTLWRGNLALQRARQNATFSNSLVVLLSAAALSTGTGREAFSGLMLGLVQASINEWTVHMMIGHPPEGLYRRFRSMGRIGEFAEEIALAHRLHHAVVNAGFGAADLTPEQVARAEIILRKLAEGLVLSRMLTKESALGDDPSVTEAILASDEYKAAVEALVARIRPGQYGLLGTRLGAIAMLTTAIPFYLLDVAIYGATGSEAFLASAISGTVFFVLQSLYSHRYLHVQPGQPTQLPTSWLQRRYMESWIGRWQRTLHLTHHLFSWEFAKSWNGVIMAFSAFDRMIGWFREPTPEQLLEIERQGFL